MKLVPYLLATSLFIVPLIVVAQTSADASDSATSEMRNEHRARKGGDPGMGKIIDDYVSKKSASGELDASEYEALREKRESLRSELKALHEAGDQEGIQAKRQAMQSLQQEQRAYVRTLMDKDPELRQQVMAQRRQHMKQDKGRQEQLRMRRMENNRELQQQH